MGFLDRASALVSRTIYEGFSRAPGSAVDSHAVVALRKMLGGNLTTQPQTRLEWLLEDVDRASYRADSGDLTMAGQLCRAFRRDPVINGLLATKSGGIARLPKQWFGADEVVDSLLATDGGPSAFDLMCPPAELKKTADDLDALRVSLAELVPVAGRNYPVLERKDPEFLFYLWPYNTWCYRSVAGIIPIVPGDGRWVLSVAGSRVAPWQDGNWHSIGRSWVRKDNCQALKDNWSFHLANAARVATAPRGATPQQSENWFQQIASWGVNSIFSAPEGWDVKLLESNGEGWKGFDTTIKQANEDFMIGIAGQLVSVTGGTGFSSEDLYSSVRFDLIQETAIPMAHAISTQVLPWYTQLNFPDLLDRSPGFKFDVKRPTDLNSEAAIYTALGAGLAALQEAASRFGLDISVQSIFAKFGIDTKLKPQGQVPATRLTLAPTDVAKVVTVDEARVSQGLPRIGDERGDLTIFELVQALSKQPDEMVALSEDA